MPRLYQHKCTSIKHSPKLQSNTSNLHRHRNQSNLHTHFHFSHFNIELLQEEKPKITRCRVPPSHILNLSNSFPFSLGCTFSPDLVPMPSPTIPRSKSAPRISGTPHSPSHSDVLSRRTSLSENSPRTWPKKVGAFIARKASSSTSSKKQALTVQSLKEFNRLNEILEDRKYFQTSPYYNGLSRLTDSSLAINRQRPTSPNHDGESHAGSLFSTSSKMSFVYKLQEWSSSCFISKDLITKDKDEKIPMSSSKSSLDILAASPSLSSSSSSRIKVAGATREEGTDRRARQRARKMAKEVGTDRREYSHSTNTRDVPIVTLKKEKPLRERLIEPPSPPPTPPHPVSQMPLPEPRLTPIQTSVQAKLPLLQSSTTQASTQTQYLQTMPPSQPQKASAQPPVTCSQTSPAEKVGKQKEANNHENETRYIWADKYRPFALKDFLCNRNKALELLAMARSEYCGNFIFEGQPGVGKRTMIWALLREVFGEDKVEAREESKKFILKGEAVGSINVKIKQSYKHVEINISELRGYEKHIIVQLIKERSDKSTDQVLQCTLENCRAIILYEADRLPTEALLYIKWVLERYKGCNKLFFCCSDASKIQPLSSLCTLLQLLPPTIEEIIQVLEFIAEKEGIKLPQQLAAKIARSSKNNLRQAIRSFEATWHSNPSLKEDQEIMTGWEDGIANIARNIIDEQSPKQLYNVRGRLQNLIEHNVSAEFIFETLVKELKKNMDERLQKEIGNIYEKYNKTDDCEKPFAPAHQQEVMGKRLNDPVRKTVQQFMRIEEFIAKFMSRYKDLVVKNKEIQTPVL